MDVDPPPLGLSNLKRSSSAPMINVLGNTSPSFRESTPPPQLLLSVSRTRRFSASFSPNHSCFSPNSPNSPGVLPSRVSQIKHEEGMDIIFREAAHERETQSKLQMSQSWEDLTLDESLSNNSHLKRPCSLTDPLHIFTPPLISCGFSSPTRTSSKQCFSPSTCQTVVRGPPFSPSPSPSPTRKTFTTRRSQSPIALRPAANFASGVKRKFDPDGSSIDSMDNNLGSPAKRSHSDPRSPISMSHPLAHSLSAASLDMAVSSPDQTVPQEGSLVDMTDSMSSSSGSPCGSFKPLVAADTPPPVMEEVPSSLV